MLDAFTATLDGDIQVIDKHLRPPPPAGCNVKNGDRDYCLGRSRGGLTTKIHAVVDGEGVPIRLSLTAGQSHDGQAADYLLDYVGAGTIVLADKAYDADRVRGVLHRNGAFAHISPKASRRSKPFWYYMA